jgi:hypothetical protein
MEQRNDYPMENLNNQLEQFTIADNIYHFANESNNDQQVDAVVNGTAEDSQGTIDAHIVDNVNGDEKVDTEVVACLQLVFDFMSKYVTTANRIIEISSM